MDPGHPKGWKSASDFANAKVANHNGDRCDFSYADESMKYGSSTITSPRGTLLNIPTKDTQTSPWIPRIMITLWLIMLPLAFIYRNQITSFVRTVAIKGSEQGKLIYVYYLCIFIFVVPFFISVELMVVSAGFVFSHIHGQWVGVAVASGLSFTAYFITMLLCFLLSRHLLKSFVNRYLRHYKYYNALIRATEKDGLPLVAMIRLSPFFPPTIISYIFGTTNVQTHHYCIASFAALPSIIFFSYVGTLIEDFSSDASPPRSTAEMTICITTAVGITVAGLYYTFVVTKKHLEPKNPPQLNYDSVNVAA